MNFAGKEQLDTDRETVWKQLNDMPFMAGLVPNTQGTDELRDDGFSCRVRPGFSFLSGTLRLNFQIVDAQPPERLKVVALGKGIGASVTVEIGIQLNADGGQTELVWSAAIAKRTGLLKPIGDGLIQAAAQRVVDDFWSSFRSGLAG